MWSWMETSQTERVRLALRAVPETGGLVILAGDHGVGKSWAVDGAIAHGEEVIRVELPPADERARIRPMVTFLAEQLGIRRIASDASHHLIERIAQKISDGRQVVVIDSGQDLRSYQLDVLRYLVDRLPSLVVATSETQRFQSHGALWSRHTIVHRVKPLALDEVLELFGGEFGEGFLRTAHERAGGKFWLLRNQIILARFEAQHIGRATTELSVEDAERVSRTVLQQAA